MGKKFKVWLDSGANAHSKYEQFVDLWDNYGITDEEWEGFSEGEKEEIMRDIAFAPMSWDYEEIES